MLEIQKNFFKRLPWQIIFAVFLGIFFLRNLLMLVVADDYSYAFIWDGEGRGNLIDGLDPNRLQPIESFGDILKSQWSHYFTWGGRTIAHIFVQLFVWENNISFDVTNTFVFAAFVLLLFKIGTGLSLREMNKSYLLFILAGIYFCVPTPAITMVWLTGACNYLWMSALIILFLLPFVTKYRRADFWKNPPAWSIPAMALLGLCAGWSIEPGAAVAAIITFLFVVNFYFEKNLQPWAKVGFVFLLIGAAILFLSPGNFYRLELTNTLEPDDLIPPDEQWTAQMFLTNFVVGFLPVFVRNLILFVPIIFYLVKGRTSPAVSKLIALFAGMSIFVLLLMLCSPEFPERAGFSSTVLLLIASLAAFKEILPDVKNFCYRRIKMATLAATIFAVFWSLNILGCLYVEYDLHCQFKERDEYIAAHKNDDLIIVQPLKLPEWSETFLGSRTWDELTLLLGGDLDFEATGSRSVTFARYHHLKQIILGEKH